mmetsp:Transcript_23367/g.37278  ORF Transcript_23367/g.37278 Transcript_23367/m.37278 type:complete len:652 (-) Transcript_23367:1627-3582(-)
MGLSRYRDIFYIVGICALSLFALNSRIECPERFHGYLGGRQISGRLLYEPTDESSLEVKITEIMQLKVRLRMAEEENRKLIDEQVNLVKKLARFQKNQAKAQTEEESQLDSDESQVGEVVERDQVAVGSIEEESIAEEAVKPVIATPLESEPKAKKEFSDENVADKNNATTNDAEIDSQNETEKDPGNEVVHVEGSVQAEPEPHDPADEEESEKSVGEEEEDDEEDDDDGEEFDTGSPPSGFEQVDGKTFKLLSQVSPHGKKLFRVAGSKFLAWFRAWEHAGWKRVYDTSPSAQAATLFLTKPITKVPGSTGKMISQISRSSCIGGSKGAQLRCRIQMAQKHGCNFTELNISPAQFNMVQRSDCLAYFDIASKPENADKMWILKDGGAYHGRNMKIFKGLKHDVKKRWQKCSKDKKVGAGWIMMEYIPNPMLMEHKKFDLRTFMLISSTTPFLVFYHEGFIRRSGATYSNSSFSKVGHITNHKSQDKYAGHFFGFQQLGEYLHRVEGFPKDFMQTTFKNYVKHTTNYIFQAARHSLRRRPGAFMLFGLDWMIDTDRKIHFLEANGNPSIQHYEGTGLSPGIWNNMTKLLTDLHREPQKLGKTPSAASGFKVGGWELIFNEAEEAVNGHSYNACKFPDYLKQCSDPDTCKFW